MEKVERKNEYHAAGLTLCLNVTSPSDKTLLSLITLLFYKVIKWYYSK